MSGERLLLDTNAVIALLHGNADLVKRCELAVWVGVSVVTILEFLAFDNLPAEDQVLLWEFVDRVQVVSLDSADRAFLAQIVAVRKRHRTKLPDAIIVASAVANRAILLSNDRQLGKLAEVAVSPH